MLINLTDTDVKNLKVLVNAQYEKEQAMGHVLTCQMLTELVSKFDLAVKKENDRVAKTLAYMNQENKEELNARS